MNKKQIYKNLGSKNEALIIEAIKNVKTQGDKDAIILLADVLLSSQNDEIINSIMEIFSCLKDTDSTPEIIKVITNDRYTPIRKAILTSCWQSGLDYSMYLDVFVDAVIAEPFESAFEAFTVIDEMLEDVQPETIDTQINKLLDAKKQISADKEAMIEQLLSIFVEAKKK